MSQTRPVSAMKDMEGKFSLKHFFKENKIWFWGVRVAIPVIGGLVLAIILAHLYVDSLSTASRTYDFASYFKTNRGFLVSYIICGMLTCTFIIEVLFFGLEKLALKIFDKTV